MVIYNAYTYTHTPNILNIECRKKILILLGEHHPNNKITSSTIIFSSELYFYWIILKDEMREEYPVKESMFKTYKTVNRKE